MLTGPTSRPDAPAAIRQVVLTHGLRLFQPNPSQQVNHARDAVRLQIHALAAHAQLPADRFSGSQRSVALSRRLPNRLRQMAMSTHRFSAPWRREKSHCPLRTAIRVLRHAG